MPYVSRIETLEEQVAGLIGGGSEPSDGDKGDILVSSSGTVWTVQAFTHNHDSDYADIVHTHPQSDVTGLVGDLAAKAPLASPAFTGTPTAPTASAGTDTTQIATTAFVQDALTTAASGFFGSGIEGDVVDSGNRTLARVHTYNNWTIQNGATITPARFPVFVAGTLTIDSGGFISQNGVNASGQTAGTGGGASAAGMMGVGSSGGNGGNVGAGGSSGVTSAQQPIGIGTACKGGNGGGAAVGGTLTEQAAINGNPYIADRMFGFFPYNTTGAFTPVNGGSGGGGGAGGGASGVGGGGGGGGGVVVIIARHVINNGAIQAKGGNGANGTAANGGGGGGGGGGKVFILCQSYTGNSPDVSGGTKGTKQGTGTDGVDGNTGLIVTLYI